MIPVRRIKIHDSLIVPEDGIVFERPLTENGVVDATVLLIWVPGLARPWPVRGQAMEAVLAYARGDQRFPLVVANGVEIVDIPAGWAAGAGVREMRGGVEGQVAGSLVPARPSREELEAMIAGRLAVEAPPLASEPHWPMPPPPADSDVPDIDPERLRAAMDGSLYRGGQ